VKRAALALAFATVLAVPAAATAGPRARFEPTDLELEDPGVLDVDAQLGTFPLRAGDAPRRDLVLDWELDLGLAPNVELDVDGATSWYGPSPRHRGFDPIWVSSKLGLYAARDERARRALEIGLQIGPRIPLEHPEGIGYAALALLGGTLGASTLVLDAGVTADPRSAGLPRAVAIQVGLDLVHVLSPDWSLLGELAHQRFLTRDPHQLEATVGLAHTTDTLDVSLIGFVGVLAPGDRFGLLLGFSPKLRLFGG
jgi:hypothetical protein